MDGLGGGQGEQLAADGLAALARPAGKVLLDQPAPLVAQARQAVDPRIEVTAPGLERL